MHTLTWRHTRKNTPMTLHGTFGYLMVRVLMVRHTHPDHPSRPSPTDLRFAQQTLPGYSYAILSVENGVPALLSCWILTDDETAFEAEPIQPKGGASPGCHSVAAAP